MKYFYAVVRCPSCDTLSTLKYLGPDDGETVYSIIFPDPPQLLVFDMPCQSCGAKNRYARNDVQAVSVERESPEKIADQMPSVRVEAVKLS
jgi:hypothetical protein